MSFILIMISLPKNLDDRQFAKRISNDYTVFKIKEQSGITLYAEYRNSKIPDIRKYEVDSGGPYYYLLIRYNIKDGFPENITFNDMVSFLDAIPKHVKDLFDGFKIWMKEFPFTPNNNTIKLLPSLFKTMGLPDINRDGILAADRDYIEGEMIFSGDKGTFGDLKPYIKTNVFTTNIEPELDCYGQIMLKVTANIKKGEPFYWQKGLSGHPWDILIDCQMCGKMNAGKHACPECGEENRLCDECKSGNGLIK